MFDAPLKTPDELQVKSPSVKDHGLTVAHNLFGGAPMHYIHEISVPASDKEAIHHLTFTTHHEYSCGYVKDGIQHNVYRQKLPLTIKPLIKD